MKCTHCQTVNNNSRRYCKSCGEPFFPTSTLVQRVEDRATASVIDSAMKFAKWHGAIIYIPVALVIAIAGFFGLQKYDDIFNTLEKKRDQTVLIANKLDKEAQDLSRKSDNIEALIEKAQKDFVAFKKNI